MRVTIEVLTGILIGRRFDIRENAPAIFGRSDAATFCLPFDKEMAENHFQIESNWDAIILTALDPHAPTLVNGRKVVKEHLRPEDTITAGKTVFSVAKVVETPRPAGAAAPAAGAAPAAAGAAAAPAAAPGKPKEPEKERLGEELMLWLGAAEEVAKAAPAGQKADALALFYADKGPPAAAVRARAHALGPRLAVLWGSLCIREVLGSPLPADEESSHRPAMAWVADPAEGNRRAAEAAAAASGHKGLCCWLAQGVFWSGGSLAPADLAPVPPDPRLTGQAVAAALMMAAPHGDPKKAAERYKTFLRLGKECAEGKHPFPPAPAAGRPRG